MGDDPDLMAEMAANVKDVAVAIRETQSHWTELLGIRLYARTKSTTKTSWTSLFDELMDNEREGRRFLAMPFDSRKKFIEIKLSTDNRRSRNDDDDDDTD